jgi:hypothetical protein
MANRHKQLGSSKHSSRAFKTGVTEKTGVNNYSGSGDPNVVKEARQKTDSFKCGGKIMGKKSKGRMDKFARGGRTGGSPFSSAKIKTNGDSA